MSDERLISLADLKENLRLVADFEGRRWYEAVNELNVKLYFDDEVLAETSVRIEPVGDKYGDWND